MMSSKSIQHIVKYRRVLIVAVHAVLVALSYWLAFLLRFDGNIPPDSHAVFLRTLPLLIAARLVLFIPFRLYQGLWRYTSIWDLRNIILSVVCSSTAFFLLLTSVAPHTVPLSIFFIDAILLIFFSGCLRLGRRIYREVVRVEREKKILIYGAGDAGEMLVRDMRNNPFYEYEPIGFIDDDAAKQGQRIHGVKILGTREDLPRIIEAEQPDAVLVAIPRLEPTRLRAIVKTLECYKTPIKILPSLSDVLGGRVEVGQIRNLAIEDLLERAPIGLDTEPIQKLVQGKRILVTGAGGSIGSELCRQIVKFSPATLVLFERYENGLYEIVKELTPNYASNAASPVYPVIGDVVDESCVDQVLLKYRPEIIFHAAAHKHVPLMEQNPCEAIKNNVTGTRIMAEVATRHGVERFILISTDKAVNPTSVMGASKRVAEALIQLSSRASNTIFAGVRFGNVLGSNGSVVPLFLEQIKNGGPVTVTHPEMRRYFMLIPEAVNLVLHAAAQASGGEIFVLEMGEQIKIIDMARNLIRLSGFVPEEEIPIVFTGERNGEKLYEELVGEDETVHPSRVEKIFVVCPNAVPDATLLRERVATLERLAADGDSLAVLEKLYAVVPLFSRQNHVA